MVWFITGASHGLGLEMAHLLVARGERVLATGRRAVTQLPADFPDCAYHVCDLSDPNAVARLRDWAAAHGPLRAAVLNAGAGHFRPLAQETAQDIDTVLAINLNANITLAHGLRRALAEEWRGDVRVRVLHPGPVATGMAERAGRKPDFADRLFLPPRTTAAALLRALDAPRGADRQTVSFLRVGLHRLLRGAG